MNYVARLRAENEELLEQVRQLQEMLAPSIDPPEGIFLTSYQLRIYRCLMTRRIMNREMLTAAVFIDRPDRVLESNSTDVLLSQVRKKLAPLGIKIVNIRNQGWQIQLPHTEAV